MAVQPDSWIEERARNEGMIEPFDSSRMSQGAISFGVSSYGYDFRLSRQYLIPPHDPSLLLDPKQISLEAFEKREADSFVIDPGAYVLGRSLEYFRIPRDILTICTGKSTYARCGVLVNVTPFEPEWEGFATLSIANTGASPVRIYSREGIAQLIFLSAAQACRVSYRDKQGAYQAQTGIRVGKQEQ